MIHEPIRCSSRLICWLWTHSRFGSTNKPKIMYKAHACTNIYWLWSHVRSLHEPDWNSETNELTGRSSSNSTGLKSHNTTEPDLLNLTHTRLSASTSTSFLEPVPIHLHGIRSDPIRCRHGWRRLEQCCTSYQTLMVLYLGKHVVSGKHSWQVQYSTVQAVVRNC